MVDSLPHYLFSDFEMQLRKGDTSLPGLVWSQVFSKAHQQVFKAHAGSPSVLCPAKAAFLLPCLELALG